MEQRDPVRGTDEIQRVETALNALSAKKAANDAMRKASHDLPSSAAYGAVSRLDRDQARSRADHRLPDGRR